MPQLQVEQMTVTVNDPCRVELKVYKRVGHLVCSACQCCRVMMAVCVFMVRLARAGGSPAGLRLGRSGLGFVVRWRRTRGSAGSRSGLAWFGCSFQGSDLFASLVGVNGLCFRIDRRPTGIH